MAKKATPRSPRESIRGGKRLTWAEVAQHLENIQEAAEKHRREGKFEHFQSIAPEHLEAKLKRTNSPFITSQGWSPTAPGGSVSYSVQIYNPDPVTAFALYVHVFVGSGNVVPDTGQFLLNVDERFPRLTEPAAFGLTIASGASANVNFTINVPATIDRSKYIGNTAVFQFSPYNDVGKYIDRSVWVFTVA
jgi:hypothetical protein